MRDKVMVDGFEASISQMEKALASEKNTGYENNPQISLEEIERLIKEGMITTENKKKILDRLYEISPDSPEENQELWNRVIAAKRAVRKI